MPDDRDPVDPEGHRAAQMEAARKMAEAEERERRAEEKRKKREKAEAAKAEKKDDKKQSGGDDSRKRKKDDSRRGNKDDSRKRRTSKTEEDSVPENQLSEEELLERGPAFLDGLFERMNLDITAEGKLDDGRLHFDLSGPDVELILGANRSPKTLESIQTIARDVLVGGTSRTVTVDAGGFREKRRDRLESVARGLADAAAKIDRQITVAGLNSFERRVVHRALDEDGRVTTESEGPGAFRKLVVQPD